jgi:hypothetical protein
MITCSPLACSAHAGLWRGSDFSPTTPDPVAVNAFFVVYRETVFGGEAPLRKGPAEIRNYGFSFALQKEIEAGDGVAELITLEAVPIKATGALTLGSPTITGDDVWFSVAGGNAGDRFELRCVVETHEGWRLDGKGQLLIVRS